MLHINANIGDELDVTIIKAHRGVQTQERVNARRVFISGELDFARPGNRCRVKITGENPTRTVYFCKVLRLIKVGDGQSSLLEKAIALIDWREGLYRFDPAGTAKALEVATEHFGTDRLGLLEFLNDVVEHYGQEDSGLSPLLDYDMVCATADRIILEELADNAAAKVVAYVRLAQLSALSQYINFHLIRNLFGRALIIAESQAPELTLSVLAPMEECHRDHRMDLSASVQQRLLALQEKDTGIDIRRRLNMARQKLRHGQFAEAREYLTPALAALAPRPDRDVDHLTAIYTMGCAFLGQGDFQTAEAWLMRAQQAGKVGLEAELARACHGMGAYQRAAEYYSIALQERDEELQSHC
ncbi:MAG: hypothetical protein JSS86_11345 [Cyanobacteria bacterium SZAS LIN-2]|nr:hypothetical protein [Cyanobacteria bacterium SZAS LIN-2]